jgi:hypothetical protein
VDSSDLENSYSDRMQSFVTDPELKLLEDKYEPYLDIHVIEDILEVCDIIQAKPGEPVTGKLIWHTEHDLPIELKKDIIKLYRRHFVN